MTERKNWGWNKWNEINSNILYLNSTISIGTLNQYSLSTPIQYQKFSKEKNDFKYSIKVR